MYSVLQGMLRDREPIIHMVSSTMASVMDGIHIKGILLGGCGVDNIV